MMYDDCISSNFRIQRAWRKYIKSSNASTSAAALLCKKSKIQHPRPMDQNKDSKYHLLYTIDVSDTSSEGLPKEYETAELDLLDHHSKALNSSYYCGEFEFELDAELELPTDSDKTFSVPTKPTVVMDHTTSTLLHEKLVPELQHLAGSLQSRLDGNIIDTQDTIINIKSAHFFSAHRLQLCTVSVNAYVSMPHAVQCA